MTSLLRNATVDDARLLWRIRMDPDVRRVSRRTGEIPFEEYERDLKADLDDPDCHWWVVVDDVPVGYVNLRHGEISLALVAAARGRGLGTQAIREATALHAGGELRAVVRRENDRSAAAFEAAGYTVESESPEFVVLRSR